MEVNKEKAVSRMLFQVTVYSFIEKRLKFFEGNKYLKFLFPLVRKTKVKISFPNSVSFLVKKFFYFNMVKKI